MAPLGVLTAVAGAIRVGGASWLKRLVGRARENNITAEIDLMSSVSQEVCELWNGKSIVRSTGRPEVKQIIHFPAEEGDISPESFITVDTLKSDAMNTEADNSENKTTVDTDNKGDTESGIPEKSVHPTDYKDIPPNISLNIHGGSKPIELWVCAITATILQIAVLVWSAFTAYSSYARKRSSLTGIKPSIGFPLQVAGTVLLTCGLYLCAGIIDNASCEQHWPRQRKSQVMTVSRLLSSVKATFQARANKQRLTANQSSKENSFRRRDMQLYWVQKQHTAGDNSFDPYILYAKELKSQIHESHRAEEKGQSGRDDVSLEEKPKPYKKTTFAVVIGILGFLAQFQGLRLLNWTCSIAQLIALIVATILRAWVRRSMNKTPVAVPVNNDYILDNLALAIVGKGPNVSKFPNPEALRAPGLSLAFGITATPKLRAKLSTNVQPLNEVETKPSLAQQALDLRVKLGHLTKWTGPKCQGAINLANSIEAALERLRPQLPKEFGIKRVVVLQVTTYRNIPHAFREEAELGISKVRDRWKVNDAQLEALMSLVSYSTWLAEQNRRNRKETDRGKILERRDSSGNCINEKSIEDSRPVGWLRAKPPESQTYHTVFGKSSPKLLSDLYWWTASTKEVPDKVGICKENTVAVVRDSGLENDSDSEAKSDKVVELHALGFDVNDEASKETSMITVQLHVWRTLTCPDTTYWSSECTEEQAFILHLFSAFMWATMEFILSASQFHPTTVTGARKTITRSRTVLFPLSDEGSKMAVTRFPQLKSDEISTLVQTLQRIGLGTSEEIYGALIPPLSHFDKLPNEAVADWCNETLIAQEAGMKWDHAFNGYVELLEGVQYREVQDRFAARAAAIVIGFLVRVTEDSQLFSREREVENLKRLRRMIENKNVLKVILSLKEIFARQRGINEDDHAGFLMKELGFDDQKVYPTSYHTLEENDYSFPNETDVFGWTEWYLTIIKGKSVERAHYNTLDLAGQSALHHAVTRAKHSDDPTRNSYAFALKGFADHNLLEDSELMTAKCNKQTPLHRAARAGHGHIISRLLFKRADPNAADFFGRTALLLALYHGHFEEIDKLWDAMDHGGRNHRDGNERNALHYAILHCPKPDVLLKREANPATLEKKEDAALDLINKGVDITPMDIWYGTPLRYAASEGMKRVVEHLLKQDRMNLDNLERGKEGHRGLSPEQEAERAGHKEIAEMLRDAKEEKEKQEKADGKENDIDFTVNE